MDVRCRFQTISRPNTYQANTLSESRRESKEDVHGWAKPSRPPVVASSGLVQLNLLLEDGEDGTGSKARLELSDEGDVHVGLS